LCLDEFAHSTRSREQTLSFLPAHSPGELTSGKNVMPHIFKASGDHRSPTLEPLNPKPLNGCKKRYINIRFFHVIFLKIIA
jgi:hypothetical protein